MKLIPKIVSKRNVLKLNFLTESCVDEAAADRLDTKNWPSTQPTHREYKVDESIEII